LFTLFRHFLITQVVQILGLLFSQHKLCSNIDKAWVGLHFGLFSQHKLCINMCRQSMCWATFWATFFKNTHPVTLSANVGPRIDVVIAVFSDCSHISLEKEGGYF
jgi:hypothetical protein